MKILIAASEAVPFFKTGGLADVVGTLARKVAQRGHEVALFLPRYRGPELSFEGPGHEISVELGGQKVLATLRGLRNGGVRVFFVDCPPLFDRKGLYGENGVDYPDNDRRFIFFSRAILEGARAAGFMPDVIHLHDWQTGAAAAYLKRQYRADPFFAAAASIFTVHNMAYQGVFPPETVPLAALSWDDFTSGGFEYYGKFSFLKAGLVFADLISTVSPTYAREIQESPDRGFGLEGLLKHRSGELRGIINGLDLEVWNPETDHALTRRYGAADVLAGKAACKSALQRRCGLAERSDIPLLGIVSRLDRQKGLDLAIEILRPRLERCQLVVLGSGEPALAAAFSGLAKDNPQSVYMHSGFDEPFAHQLYAACDLFLMPSRFEPCGLGQMIAMRYGAVPVVSLTGGLVDTVAEGKPPANGFTARPDDAADLGRAVDRALAVFGGQDWKKLARSAMSCDFSWDRSIDRYLELYDAARRRANVL